jgi:CBS domain-containing protein
MRISRLYTRDVVTAELSETVLKAARRMRLHDVSALPVVEHGQLIGIVTERNITRAVAEGKTAATTSVAEIMTQQPLVARPDEDGQEVAARMVEHGVRHRPVVDKNRVVGMFSVRDHLLLEIWQPRVETPIREGS